MNGCKHTKDNRNFQWPEGFSISDIQTKISIYMNLCTEINVTNYFVFVNCDLN